MSMHRASTRTRSRSISMRWLGAANCLRSVTLNETKSSLDTKVHVAAEKVAAESLNKFLIFPAGTTLLENSSFSLLMEQA